MPRATTCVLVCADFDGALLPLMVEEISRDARGWRRFVAYGPAGYPLPKGMRLHHHDVGLGRQVLLLTVRRGGCDVWTHPYAR